MNDITLRSKPSFRDPITPKSSGLRALLDFIAEGASEQEQERRLPFDIIDTVRQSRLGALRIRASNGGPGPLHGSGSM